MTITVQIKRRFKSMIKVQIKKMINYDNESTGKKKKVNYDDNSTDKNG